MSLISVMKGLTAVVAIYSLGVRSHNIQKRNFFQLCTLINQFTNNPCFIYNQYGCFCGYGQHGTQPVDEIDSCCKTHDECYGEITRNCDNGHGGWLYYDYTCQDQSCLCLDEDLCLWNTCECDVHFAECLAARQYNVEYHNYNRTQCG